MDNTLNASQEAEIKHCAEDFVYFCETYIKIIHPTRGLVPFQLHDYQKRYVKALGEHRFLAAIKFRQGGFTTTTLVWLLWRLLFKLDESNMVMCKTDKEAVYCNNIVRQIIRELPDFLQPKFTKCNDHTLHAEDTNSRMFFHTPEAACGRSINYLFIDESAFIKDMDKHWKAMWPTLSTGGHCITVSTTNGINNWFHDIVYDARQHKNQFFIFIAEYHEHPDYNCPDWVAQTKHNLGDRHWRQEVLCEFLDEMTLDDRFKRGVDFLCEVTAAEEAEFIAKREAEFEKKHGSKKEFAARREAEFRKMMANKTSAKKDKEEGWEITSNKDVQKLVFEDCDYDFDSQQAYNLHGDDIGDCDLPFNEWVYKETEIKDWKSKKQKQDDRVKSEYKPEVIQFEQLTREQIHDKFKKEHEGFDISKVKHPEISDPKEYSTAEEMAELFSDLWGDDTWAKMLKKQQRENRRMQERLDACVDAEAMALCGLITQAEAAAMGSNSRPDLKIIKHLVKDEDFPDNINFEFFDGFLCVNEVPTVLKEDDIRDAYNGYLALTSEKEAIDTVVSLLKNKLMPLFGVVKENENV